MTLSIAILGLVRHGDPAVPRLDLDRAGRARFRRLRAELREELGDLDEVCVCTCIRAEHRHWRPGTDCRTCGKACPAFRRARQPARRKIIFWRNR